MQTSGISLVCVPQYRDLILFNKLGREPFLIFFLILTSAISTKKCASNREKNLRKSYQIEV
jgi:hypothetical protein